MRVAVVALLSIACLSFALLHMDLGPTRAQTVRKTRVTAKYSKFSHFVDAHRKDCSSCHSFPSANWDKVRPQADAFPDVTEYPKHDSCVTCHREQFFSGKPPQICAICHVSPSPDNSSRFPFPNPADLFDKSKKAVGHESAFDVAFPHDKHIDIVSRTDRRLSGGFLVNAHVGRRGEESCAVCHATVDPQSDGIEFVVPPPKNWGDRYWLRKGTFKSPPRDHSRCFTCHSAESGMSPAPADCAMCHKPRQSGPRADHDPALAVKMGILDRATLAIARTRYSAGAFRHGMETHSALACATCHAVDTLNTADPKTTIVAMTACTGCHTTPSAADGGILNIEMEKRKKSARFDCSKCHVTFGRSPIPQSHTQALVEAGQ